MPGSDLTIERRPPVAVVRFDRATSLADGDQSQLRGSFETARSARERFRAR
jgi:hypothetical protein